jgi:hypothetical protein
MVAEKLERYVIGDFSRHLGQLAGSPVISVPEVQGARARLEEAEAELVGYRDDLRIRSVLGHEAYVAGLEVRVEAVRAAQAALAEAQAGSQIPDLPATGDEWESLSVRERRALLAAGIDCVVLRRGDWRAPMRERVRILWHGEAPQDLPGRGGPVRAIRPFDWPDDPVGAGVPAA